MKKGDKVLNRPIVKKTKQKIRWSTLQTKTKPKKSNNYEQLMNIKRQLTLVEHEDEESEGSEPNYKKKPKVAKEANQREREWVEGQNPQLQTASASKLKVTKANTDVLPRVDNSKLSKVGYRITHNSPTCQRAQVRLSRPRKLSGRTRNKTVTQLSFLFHWKQTHPQNLVVAFAWWLTHPSRLHPVVTKATVRLQ